MALRTGSCVEPCIAVAEAMDASLGSVSPNVTALGGASQPRSSRERPSSPLLSIHVINATSTVWLSQPHQAVMAAMVGPHAKGRTFLSGWPPRLLLFLRCAILLCLLGLARVLWTEHAHRLVFTEEGHRSGCQASERCSPEPRQPIDPRILWRRLSVPVPTTRPALRPALTNTSGAAVPTFTDHRFACTFLTGDLGDDAVSRCLPLNDTHADAQRRQRGDVLSGSPMRANVADPYDGGAIFFVRHSVDRTGGVVDVVHENCRPGEVGRVASNETIRRYIERQWGPTTLQLFVVGPELHSSFLVHVTEEDGGGEPGMSGLHPCRYRLSYLVHTAGLYQLHLQWMYTDYHILLEGQPLWPRGLYGELLGPSLLPPRRIEASPIVIPHAVPHGRGATELQVIERWGATPIMALPNTFPRLDPRLGHNRYRQPQGQGRWMQRALFPPNSTFPSNMFWARKSYREELGVEDLASKLKLYRDCYFADIDRYMYVPYAYSLLAARELSQSFIDAYTAASWQSLEAHPSLPPVSLASSQRCFTGVHVTLIGDSHTRHLFNAFITHVLNVDDFKAVKDERNRIRINHTAPAPSSSSSSSSSASPSPASRRLRMIGGLPDSAVDPWNALRPLPDFAAFQCLSKGDAFEGSTAKRDYVVEDACTFQTGWPDGRSKLVHAALIQSDLVLYSWGQWQAANDPSMFPFMRIDHVAEWLTGHLQHWASTNLTQPMHQHQIDRWEATHQHVPHASDNNPFRYRLDPARVRSPSLIPLGELTLLDLAREKLLWWTAQVYASHHHPNWYRDHDGRTPARLQAYAEVQRAVLSQWGIRQFSDTIHVAQPFRNCVPRNDHGHIIAPIYDAQLAGIVDKAMQMRQCRTG